MSAEFDIYLASASPRRQELLTQIGVRFELLKVNVPEVPAPGEIPQDFVQRVALEKARAGKQLLSSDDAHPVLGADTAVVVDGGIFGKPANKDDALAMLTSLSGRKHQVISAVAVVADYEATRINISQVTFDNLSREQINAYWNSGECQDKAGAYAIQGRAASFIQDLQGSYSGVMGLPLYETAGLLQQFGINSMR
ncbi:MAG: Maf family nucleotide pyrophosphatase [Gammaproteobacteria bacterium]|nr:Maf family nucleotide pyrophosphatase [Gammaproteobacteria bacterium]